MKKTVILVLASFLSVANVHADILKEGSVYCVNLKKMINYDNYVDAGRSDLSDDLLDRADCYTKNREEEVYVKSKSKDYAEIKLLDGFTVWTNKNNIKAEQGE